MMFVYFSFCSVGNFQYFIQTAYLLEFNVFLAECLHEVIAVSSHIMPSEFSAMSNWHCRPVASTSYTSITYLTTLMVQ
ncbi:hypothetical protein QVD17_14911 [Tagetes erecta]|uniref:Uncharacterized protein n=1 Tax=Tagetes erecta TaxID=13708 RepID=A0AAD8NZ17_TARER|nr:hypothetical protein QVD17_14911 [Tagetes erecta]